MKIFQLNKALIPAVLALVPTHGARAQSDYDKDKTKTFVQERASEALEQVNTILCMFDQTKYGDPSLLNSGYYTALVDESVCEGRDNADKSSGSSSGGTSANGATEYNKFKVRSQRASATAPQEVSAFLKVKGPGEVPLDVQVKMKITEAASEFNPVGAFTLSYKGSMPGVPLPIMKGVVKSERDGLGRVVIKYGESVGFPGGGELSSIKAALYKNTEGGTGSTFEKETNMEGPGGKQTTTHFAYNKSNFKRKDAGATSDVCLSRTSFETSAWRYGLYNKDTGARVNVNSGFPINTRADGRGDFGFLGFYGLFMPPGASSLGDGATVYRVEPGANGPVSTPYTLVVKDGKLKRFVRSEVALGSLKNIPLEGMVPIIGDTDPNAMKRLQWNGSELAVVAQASMQQSGPPQWNPVTPPRSITASTPLLFGDIGAYSEALGGQVRIKLAGCAPVNPFNPALGVTCAAPTASTTVVFFKESTVQPTDATLPASFRCYDNCPKAGGSGMSKNDLTYANDGNSHDYTYATGLLRDGGNPATLSEAADGQPWGFNSGPLFEPSVANLQALACPWDAGQICPWQAWGALNEFFVWETGPNNWNKYTSVMGSDNSFVRFDPPIPVKYVYPAVGTGGVNPSAVDSRYAGNTFFLKYGGFGNLQGIPGKCFNPEDPSDTSIDCSKPGRRWVPEFTIPAGSLAQNGDGVDAFYIKPLEVEQRMAKVQSSQCTSIKIVDLSGSWPNLDKDWEDPNLGAEPQVEGAAKVIAGVIQ
jgi:hypothetical protein